MPALQKEKYPGIALTLYEAIKVWIPVAYRRDARCRDTCSTIAGILD